MSTQPPKTSKCIYLHLSVLHFPSVKWEQCRPQLTAVFHDHHRKPTKPTTFSSEQHRKEYIRNILIQKRKKDPQQFYHQLNCILQTD